ncbi:hypothetical protein SBA3_1550011 [Candidatus Sulfopaludibacter sp. SbA3]|nr:hypothetical protein SBA3_1550011 [Candidatus Sulfopaludibacter sp. SbA3]
MPIIRRLRDCREPYPFACRAILESKASPHQLLCLSRAVRLHGHPEDAVEEGGLPTPPNRGKTSRSSLPGGSQRLFDSLNGLENPAVLLTCYGAGLGISEAVSLHIGDVDNQRMLLRVEHGKGAKDRFVMLSPTRLSFLRAYFRIQRPQGLPALSFYNKEVVYGILFRATSQTLLLTAAERLGVELGIFCVLHSWGQSMHFHPHLHCVVPGGGLSFLQERWIAAKRRFFLPVKALSRRFRKLMLKGLTKTVWYMLSLPRGPHPCLVVSRPLYSPRRHQ